MAESIRCISVLSKAYGHLYRRVMYSINIVRDADDLEVRGWAQMASSVFESLLEPSSSSGEKSQIIVTYYMTFMHNQLKYILNIINISIMSHFISNL